ncbi:MAG: OmpA family protein [Treponema sp.]|nr:OmpA family protein [Treponema sp.]
MKKTLVLATGIFIFAVEAFCADSVLFKFKQKTGDSVSHISTVEEEAYINGYLNNRTQFINRTSTTITEVDENGNAKLHTKYMTTQNNLMERSGKNLNWGEEAEVTIQRDSNGQLHDSDNSFLPTVQSIPSFPEKAVKIGESWTASGKEVHDCRTLFNMYAPIEAPFNATYTYLGNEEIDGKKLQLIDVQYRFEEAGKIDDMYQGSTFYGMQGYAHQKIYWDNQKGDIDHYTEEFEIVLQDIPGNYYTYKGISHGEVTGYKSLNDDSNVKKFEKSVKRYRLDNISVKKGEKGLTISLDNIQFEPDSDKLLPSEKQKLQKISNLLKEYSNDLLITGHTAARGSVNARQTLSEQRAESVASYLKMLGVRDEYHIFTQGKGSTEPVAENDTEEGRSKNRRVEIILMD